MGTIMWNKTTGQGVTIKNAADYAMTVPAGSVESSNVAELYPDVAAVASQYGDSDNKYAMWLSSQEHSAYILDANFFWNQPLTDFGFLRGYRPPKAGIQFSSSAGPSATGSAPHVKSTVGTVPDSGAFSTVSSGWRAWGMLYGACTIVMVVSFTEFL